MSLLSIAIANQILPSDPDRGFSKSLSAQKTSILAQSRSIGRQSSPSSYSSCCYSQNMESEGTGSGRRSFKRVAVYCGASDGKRPEYAQAARDLGQELVKRNIKLVYGGGNVGLMGEISRTVWEGLGKGSVVGVIPEVLQPREVSGDTVGEVRVVPDIHVRKAMMSAEADAFIAIPGGFGTLEELLEMVTWQQLGFHDKPVGVLNVCGFYDHLLRFADHLTQEGFVRPASRQILQDASSPSELLDKLERYQPPTSLITILAAERKAEELQLQNGQ